ncbi:MAG: hypothetical protein Tsb0013_13030 [Phycisphaerales bacterium]
MMGPDSLPLPMLVISASGHVQRCNAPASRPLGVAPEGLVGTPLADLFEDGHALAGRLLVSGDDRLTLHARVAGGRGTWREVDLHARRSDTLWTILVSDATERASARDELARLQRALADEQRERSRAQDAQRALTQPTEPVTMIGRSAPILRLSDEIDRVARAPSTVLIHGESGSGKELVARAIHSRSSRAHMPLVTLNCAAMPETLLESELFGHERGSFTGADRQRLGKFELAHKGTLFLDEIAELSAAAQAKLLRVLQDGTIVRVGGSETIATDVRLIAASHRDLPERVRSGRFREDLFYRLNVFRLSVPPLRERAEDIKPLAEFFHERHARRMARPVRPISERSMRRLLGYRFPGNVRELENTIERATLLMREHDEELDVQLPESSVALQGEGAGRRDTSTVPRDVLLDLTLEQLQRLQIMHALEATGYKVSGAGGAAEKLEINPQTLLSRMDKLGIPRPRAAKRARSL